MGKVVSGCLVSATAIPISSVPWKEKPAKANTDKNPNHPWWKGLSSINHLSVPKWGWWIITKNPSTKKAITTPTFKNDSQYSNSP